MSSESTSSIRRLLGPLLALAGLILILGCHLRWLSEPFDASFSGFNSGAYYGYAARAFDRHGFLDLRLQPAQLYLESTSEVFLGYLNHPPAPHLLTATSYQLFGRDERALRLPQLVFILIAAFALYRLAPGAAGGAAVLLYGTTPLILHFGAMVDAAPMSTALLAPCLLAWLRRESKPGSSSEGFYFGCALAASLIDWFGYFIVLPLVVDAMIKGGGLRRVASEIWRAGRPFLLGLGLFVAWLIWAEGGLTDALQQLERLFGVPAQDGDVEVDWRDDGYFGRMRSHVLAGFGKPLLICAALGLAAAIIGDRSGLRRSLILLGAGLLPSIAFWNRAMIHDFWIMTAAPGLALLAAQMLSGSRRLPLLLPAIGLIVVAVLGFRAGLELHDDQRTPDKQMRGETLNTFASAEDVIFTPGPGGAVRFYTDATLIPIMASPAAFDLALDILEPAREKVGKLFFATPVFLLHKAAWVLGIGVPIFPESARQVPFGTFAEVAIVEIDKRTLFKRRLKD